jgi:hypothetical protein
MIRLVINGKKIYANQLYKAAKYLNLSISRIKKYQDIIRAIKLRIHEATLKNIRLFFNSLGIKGTSRMTKTKLIELIGKSTDDYLNKSVKTIVKFESEDDKAKKEVNTLLRNHRVVKSNMGIINQNEFIKMDLIKFINYINLADDGDIYSTSLLGRLYYFNVNFIYFLSYAYENILKCNSFEEGGGTVKIYYCSKYLTDKLNPLSAADIGYGHTDPLNLQDVVTENIDYSLYLPISSPTIVLGFKILLPLKKNKNGVNKNINVADRYRLLAYSPSVDRKYHELTCASTSTNKLCIYETFLDVIGERPLIYRHNKNDIEDLKIRLKNEGQDIEHNAKRGYLFKSLELLTKKYDNDVIVKFYESKEEENDILVSKGEINETFDKTLFIGKKAFLYHKNLHVAPFMYGKTECEKKSIGMQKVMKNYVMRPIYTKAEQVKNTRVSCYGYDSETFLDVDKNCVVYNICIYGKRYDGVIIAKSFYGLDCLNVFIDFIDSLCDKDAYTKKSRPKEATEQIYIYGFNNAKFDNLLIYDLLYKKNPSTYYNFAQSAIKVIEYYNIKINDMSLFYSCGSLRDTCEAFGLEKEKGVFPYKFVNNDNLDYIGEVPGEEYWNIKKEFNKDTNKVDEINDYDIYIKKFGKSFNMKEYTEKYCLLDCELTYLLGEIHLTMCKGKIGGRTYNLTKCNTAAKLSVSMFQQVFLKDNLYQSPPKIIKKERKGYKGGRTEVFKSKFMTNDQCERLYYFDINSSYPSSMVELMPFKYLSSMLWNKKVTKDNIDFITPYNLYKTTYKYVGNDPHYIPNLLLRCSKTKEVISVKNDNKGSWHWGSELIEAVKNGNELLITKEERYEGKAIFKEFVDYFYAARLEAKNNKNAALVIFFKLLLNSLYGKFGQKPFDETKLCMSNNEVFETLSKDNGLLVDFETVKDFIMIKYSKKDAENHSIGNLCRFSSYIAALSRCKLSVFMRDVGHENVYYCDTDSVFTSKKPSDNLVDPQILGKWKEETETPIIKACFIAPKTYTYKCEDGEQSNKAKGLKGANIHPDEYYDLVDGKIDKIKQEMTMFFRGYENVKVEDKQIRTMKLVNNKRIWGDNTSSPFDNIDDWVKNKDMLRLKDNEIKKLEKRAAKLAEKK